MTVQWIYIRNHNGVITSMSASDLKISLPCVALTHEEVTTVRVPGWVAHMHNTKRALETVAKHLATLEEWRPSLPCTVTLTLCEPRPPDDVERLKRLLAPVARAVRAWAGWDDDAAEVTWDYTKRTDRAARGVEVEFKPAG